MQNHLSILGWKVEDKVSGFCGVATHVGMDLYGCIQVIVHAAATKEKNGTQTVQEGRWFDISRLEKIGRTPVMKPIPAKGDLVFAGAEFDKPVK